MLTLNLAYKQKTKKITLPKTINQQDLLQLITSSFKLQQKVIGLTNSKGQLITIQQLQSKSNKQTQVLFLITTQDINDDNMSFASDHAGEVKKNEPLVRKDKRFNDEKSEIPEKLQGYYQGVIGDLQLFEQMFLQEEKVTIVFCFVKEKPKKFMYPYYLFHTGRNSAIIYLGNARVCEFFIQEMSKIPKEIEVFVQSLRGTSNNQAKKSFKQLLEEQSQSQVQQENPFAKVKAGTRLQMNKKKASKQEAKFVYNNDVKQDDDELLNGDMNFDQENQLQQQEKLEDFQEDQPFDEQQQQPNLIDDNSQQSQAEGEQLPEQNQQQQVQASLLENLLKLKQDGDITQLQFYRMKSQLLQNFSDFMRKYQMGTRKGFRKERSGDRQRDQERERERQCERQQERQQQRSQQRQRQRYVEQKQTKKSQDKQKTKYTENQQKKSNSLRQPKHYSQSRQQQTNTRQSQQQKLTSPLSGYSRQQRRSKKYQIPIIVRKYNNVIQKISTSYPLTQQQQQSINLILQLQLKGLISQKQSGIYKSCILQQDKDILPLFLDYFDSLIDQLELVSRMKKIKKINSQKKERSQHNMRLLIKYSRQQSYQLLRNLLIDNNHLVLAAFQKFKMDKNVEKLALRLEKIASVYRQKGQLEEEVFQ